MNRRSFLTSAVAGIVALLLPKLSQAEPESPCYWKGDVAHIRIYNSAMTAEDIQDILATDYHNYSYPPHPDFLKQWVSTGWQEGYFTRYGDGLDTNDEVSYA